MSDDSQSLIELKNLSFSYKDQVIFQGINHSFAPHRFIGVLGVNGSGKSTLLNLISSVLHPHSGEVLVFGKKAGDPSHKKQVSAALQEIAFPATEKVEEIVQFICDQYGESEDPEKLISDFSLESFRHKACGQLSGGMKRRLALACAFAGRPQLVLLDEPTTGLDKPSREKLIGNIRRYQQNNGVLVLMISHHPEEVVQWVDEFVHVDKGQIKVVDPKRVVELARYKKISFRGSQAPNFLQAKKIGEKQWQCVSPDGDQSIKQLVASGQEFSDLKVMPVDPVELLGELS